MNQKNSSRLLVTGATSQIGHFLLPRLMANENMVYAISRNPNEIIEQPNSNLVCIKADISQPLAVDSVASVACLIHIAPLWLLPRIIDQISSIGVKRIIAFGSTSVFTKMDSRSKSDTETAKGLERAESQVKEKCESLGIKWTVFRPTMIYGCGMDRNVTAIAEVIKRFGFFPVAGGGKGLRCPVHADDLAQACVQVIDKAPTFNKAYNLSGGERLTYRLMVERIFEGLHKTPRVVPMPLPVLKAVIWLVRTIRGGSEITTTMADRMLDDLCFDHAEATQDFGYSPRGFMFK